MSITFRSDIKRVPWVVRRAVADALEGGAKHLVRTIKANLNTPYPPASAPGEFPHRRTGNLRANIDYWINRKTLEVYVGPTVDAEYAFALEFGAPRNNLEPRPFMTPSYMQIKSSIGNRIGLATRKAMRKYMK